MSSPLKARTKDTPREMERGGWRSTSRGGGYSMPDIYSNKNFDGNRTNTATTIPPLLPLSPLLLAVLLVP